MVLPADGRFACPGPPDDKAVPEMPEKSSGCAEVRTRPYDLRHAFATHTLMQWIENGNDVMALLPYLSAYMGHSKISSTFYYIHLLPQRLRESAGIEWDTLDEIYREGEHYEEI